MWFSSKKTQQEAPSQKILDLFDQITDLKIQMKEVKNDLIKMDIRILENQKNYQTKLLRLIDKEKEEKVEPKEEKAIAKDIYNGVMLIE